MIDKNDVKMPVQRDENGIDFSNEETERRVVDLLDMVNSVESKQELRLNNDYYSRFNWFGNSSQKNSYFSYQEEAVYDFIFNLNKSGILSDQVGMGKTIEAGMIISELASRKELKSLLIIVPNEIMAQKWHSELEDKFGIRSFQDGNVTYPEVSTVRNYNDFCECVYNCIAQSFKDFTEHVFTHKYEKIGSGELLKDVIEKYIRDDIKLAVKLLNDCCRKNPLTAKVEIQFDGKEFAIKGTKYKRPYVYGESGDIAEFLKARGTQATRPESAINSNYFTKSYNNKLLKNELKGLFVLLGDYFAMQPQVLDSVAQMLTKVYPILVIPISYTEQVNGKYETKEFLNRVLSIETNSYKHKYFSNGQVTLTQENYRIIDFFIKVGYQTLIVDEVHDYIDVSDKVKRSSKEVKFKSDDYDRYELFDDYYFIRKSSLYKKLKRLADKAVRKIFLTATPIKSDMVDFYLLTLIASNKDADAYNHLLQKIDEGNAFKSDEERNRVISELCVALVETGINNAVKDYHDRHNIYDAEEKTSTAQNRKYLYPFFTKYVRDNSNSEENLRNYLRSQVDYMTAEEITLELLLAAAAEKISTNNVRRAIESLTENLRCYDGMYEKPMTKEIMTRIVFRALLDNTVKMRFEEDFTTDSGYIKRINDLLKLQDGPRRWFKTYRKYGIRHTRHQTYNLANCEQLENLGQNKIERYKNLPIWPKRDGKVIFLFRDDCFFDSFVDVKRQLDSAFRQEVDVTVDDLPNYDTLLGTKEEKQQRFGSAKAIFDYINDAMSGGSEDTHEPQSSNYESVSIDDELIVDYKLSLVNRLMVGTDAKLGSISRKVLLFAENDREAILEWFKYQKCQPLYYNEQLDAKTLENYQSKWARYGIGADISTVSENWQVADTAEALQNDGNVLVIIDPKRYEKGVDLQMADTIINFDINYDPLKMEQRIGRIDRIRPSGRSQKINIISFVALNDMSGFVINFFANELKMFTQWMGETTGIVSVDDSSSKDGDATNSRGVSFESNVNSLDEHYRHIYQLCMSKDKISDSEIEAMSKGISSTLGTDRVITFSDMKYLHALRKPFDALFRNSITPQRQGYAVNGSSKRVIRFNSSYNVFDNCDAETCSNCSRQRWCNAKDGTVWNDFDKFSKAVKEFFKTGVDFCQKEMDEYHKTSRDSSIHGVGSKGGDLEKRLMDRSKEFDECSKKVTKLVDELGKNKDCFTVPFDKFNEIYGPIKRLYWDTVAKEYVQTILNKFYDQCDSVLKSAKLFEKFIKTFSIAEFMNNMEERDDTL